MLATKLPLRLVQSLRCARCGDCLSCGPIEILPDGKSFCGVCKTSDLFPSPAYDNIACYFVFPCKYRDRNCPDWYPWNEIKRHEKVCSYRPGCLFCCRHPCSYGKNTDQYNEAPFTLVASDKMLETYLTCIACNGYVIKPPILITDSGTNICYRCAPHLLDLDLRRNFPLETILQIFQLKCSYRIRGCNVYLQFGNELAHHEQICERQHIVYPKREEVKPEPRRKEVPKNVGNGTNYSSKEEEVAAGPPKKVRGVITTPRGHIYATITDNVLFGPGMTVKKAFLHEMHDKGVDSRAVEPELSDGEDDSYSISSEASRQRGDYDGGRGIERNSSNRRIRPPVNEFNFVMQELSERRRIPE